MNTPFPRAAWGTGLAAAFAGGESDSAALAGGVGGTPSRGFGKALSWSRFGRRIRVEFGRVNMASSGPP